MRSHLNGIYHGMTIRLNKFISSCGVGSRRKADQLIQQGRVTVNGKIASLGLVIHPSRDQVFVGKKSIRLPQHQKIYLMFHKPKKVLTSTHDPMGRPVVMDFFKKFKTRLFPVGRLDWDTEGLLLMTNDGDFSQSVSHPKTQIPKTYLAKLNGDPSDLQLSKLKQGVSSKGGRVKALYVKKQNYLRKTKKTWVQIVVIDGKNRQIRRMFEKIGFDVLKLQRTAIGRLKLGKLPRGQYLELSPNQRKRIFSLSAADALNKK